MDFPHYLYRSSGDNFLCPSQEFLDSLKDRAEWHEEPFNGDRTALLDVNRKGCRKCEAYREEITLLRLKINELQLNQPFESSFKKKIKAIKGAKECLLPPRP